MTRSDLSLKDLMGGRGSAEDTKLMNAKIPDTVMDGIQRVCRETGATKTNVVVALFNEGLDALRESDPGMARKLDKMSKAPRERIVKRGRRRREVLAT